MTIQTVTDNSIMMNNEDNDITLSNDKDITLMEDVHVITADPDADEGDVLRYYPAKIVTAPGTYEIRGNVATGSAEWDASTFAGFYYDIDDNIKTETLVATVTDRKLLEPDGVVYNTVAMEDDFDFDAWGNFLVLGFLAEKYFGGYVDVPDSTDDILFEESDDENVLADEQLLKILMDNDDEMTVTSGTPLAMEEGYELSIKSIDIDGNKVYLELSKDGSVVDSKVISPSADNADMGDKTYYYKKDVGDSKDVVIVAAHFKNAFRGADQDLATIDGLWQLSDTATDVSENTEYDKMTIQTVTDNSIMMNNEDNDITLSNDKDISLMEGVRIKTADPSSDEGDVLRWYIYKEAVIEGEGAEAEPTAEAEAAAEEVEETPVVEETAAAAAAAATAAAAEEAVTETATETEEAVTETAEAAEETVTETAEAAEEAVNETAEAAGEAAPGFESIFAITGLLAVAYLVLGRRE